MMHGTYIGLVESLSGKTALLIKNVLNPGFSAQFDDVSTGLGHGWHNFAADDFTLDPEATDETT